MIDKRPAVMYFLRQLKYDKEYAEKMISENIFWDNAVDLVYNTGVVLYSFLDSSVSTYREFVDFIEGNGYKIIRKEDPTFEGMIRCEIIAERS